jgi:hypothetical protein
MSDDMKEKTRIIQKRIGSTPFPDGLDGIVRDASALITELEAQLADANMRAIAADSQAQMAYEAQGVAEAQLAEVTAERDAALRYGDKAQKWFNDAEKDRSSWKRHAEAYRAAIFVSYQMALEAGADQCEIENQRRLNLASIRIPAMSREIEAAIRALTPPTDLVEQVVTKVKGGE